MASGNRQSDPAIWSKAWHRKLSTTHKALWRYLCDNCDWAGVFEADFDLVSFKIGEEITAADLQVFGDRIMSLKNGKYWLTGFIDFQQPNGVSETNNFGRSIMRSVRKNNVPYPNPSSGAGEGQSLGLLQPHSNVTSCHVMSSIVKEGGAGGTAPPADWTLPDYIRAFRAIRPEFAKLPEMGLANAFQDGPPEHWPQAFAEFARDEANAIKPANNPAKLFAGYLRRISRNSGRDDGAVVIDAALQEAMK